MAVFLDWPFVERMLALAADVNAPARRAAGGAALGAGAFDAAAAWTPFSAPALRMVEVVRAVYDRSSQVLTY